jgi:hypothetical protein
VKHLELDAIGNAVEVEPIQPARHTRTTEGLVDSSLRPSSLRACLDDEAIEIPDVLIHS